MTLAVLYVSAAGQMVGEMRGGVATDYLSDSLGSLIGTVSGGVVTYTAEYYPYGELASSTGSNVSPWGFVGLFGYFIDQAERLYVRARLLMVRLARWTTIDDLWPSEAAFSYVGANPLAATDPTGRMSQCEYETCWFNKILNQSKPVSFLRACALCDDRPSAYARCLRLYRGHAFGVDNSFRSLLKSMKDSMDNICRSCSVSGDQWNDAKKIA